MKSRVVFPYNQCVKSSLRVTIIIVLVLISTLVFISYSAYKLASSKLPIPSEPDFSSQPESSKLSYQVISYRRVKFNSNTDMVIAEVQVTAHDLCNLNDIDCSFQRNNFSLNYNDDSINPGGAPLKYIKNFKSRQLISSRVLTKNQTEQGQLYFTIPQTQSSAILTYNFNQIPQPTFPPRAE